jgi:hypothetical protein
LTSQAADASANTRLWPQVDQPISGSGADLLGRGSFVDRVGQVLDELQAIEESSVVALVGPWGSGKSSTINLIRERMSGPWQVCAVSTWAPPDVSALLADFFAAIRSALPEGRRTRQLKERLSEYAQLAVPGLGAIPMFGSAAQGVAEKALKLRTERPLQARFDALADQLHKLDLRVLVVLDDVDRLQPDELLMLLKAIRLLARFPGVYYLLAYDEQTVVDVLTCTAVAQGNSDRALAYLEKIVQVRLDLPPAQRFYTEQMLSLGISDLLARLGVPLSEEQTDRFRQLYDALLQFTLSQPRAVGRFLRQAVAYLPMLEPGEFDVVDFLALSHLRTLAPATYRLLARSKLSLVVSSASAAEGPDTDLQEQVKKRLAGECPDHVQSVLSVIGDLFPSFSDDYQTLYQREDWSRWAIARRAAVEEYFDRYFAFGVPADDIADSTVRDALAAIVGGRHSPARELVEKLFTGPDRARADRLAGKLTRLSSPTGVLEDADVVAVLLYVLALPRRAQRADTLLGSIDHHSVTWAIALIGRLSRSGQQLDPSSVRRLSDTEFTILCHAVSGGMPGSEPDAVEWLVATREQVAAVGCERVLQHIRSRDDASFDLPIPVVAMLVNRSQSRLSLADAISADMDSGRFTLADLAARFVTVAVTHDGRQLPAGFDVEALIALMGPSNLWKLSETAQDMETSDHSPVGGTDWPGRRHAGLAQLASALRQRRAEPPRPPSGVLAGGQPSVLSQSSPNHWASRLSAGPSSQAPSAVPLCVRAAVLLPGSASGLPSGLGSTNISEEARARTVVKILAETPFTAWCLRTMQATGVVPIASDWTESGQSNRIYAEFVLGQSASEGPPPLRAHCMISAGSARPAENALALGLDLVMSLPWPATSHDDALQLLSGDKVSVSGLIEPCELMMESAMMAARKAARDLFGLNARDGHLALWLATTQSLEQVIDVTAFPAVGNQVAQSQEAVFAKLPLEPGQTGDSPDFSLALRGVAVELVHELLRGAQRRSYTEFLHELRDQP